MSDARNIAFTTEASNAADTLCERFGLPQKVHAARLGIAYAIREGASLDRRDWNTGGSNYNIATLDTPAREFLALIPAFYDDPEVLRNPYRAIETLMSKGVLSLLEAVERGDVLTYQELVAEPGVPADAEEL